MAAQAAISRRHAGLRPASGGASPRWRGRLRRAAGGGRPERRRQVDAVSRARRHPQAAGGHRSQLGGLDIRDIAYLPQTVDIDRSFPISVFDFVGTGLWRSTGFFGGMGKAARDKIAQALAAVGLNGFREPQHRHAVRRADAAHAVCAGAAAGRAPDRAGRAVQRHRRQDLGRPAGAGAGAGTARGAPCWPRCTTWTWCAPFPGNPAAGARAGGVGRRPRRC